MPSPRTYSIALLLLLSVLSRLSLAQPAGGDVSQPRREPPPRAYEDCLGKKAGDSVTHMTRDGAVTATCVESPQGLVARPNRQPGERQDGQAQDGGPQRPGGQESGTARAGHSASSGPAERPPQRDNARPGHAAPGGPRETSGQTGPQRYSLEQAMSDKAQLNTIAFDGLAFLTGDFAADTFLPPGKVSDYFGFQYMRDIDAAQGGHSTSFLTRIAENVLSILREEQKERLIDLARNQQVGIVRFAEMRFPLIKAFRRNLEGDLPPGSRGLDKAAVVKLSAGLYELDGLLAYERARVMAGVLRTLDAGQKAALASLKFGDSRTWPETRGEPGRRGLPPEVSVAVMTYASEMFSWQAGNLDADTYFCPERHGMYFGGFGLKTAPAMGKKDYAISTSLTGDSGEAFLAALNGEQRRAITELVDLQRRDLAEIVTLRRAIATELRRFLAGAEADKSNVLALSRRYGELDGEISYYYAAAFARVGRSLSEQQKKRLMGLRANDPSAPKGPFLYSRQIAMPSIENTDRLFGGR